MSSLTLILLGSFATAGCFWGDEFADEFSTPEEIRAAGERCGLENFEPTRAGDGWAAYVDEDVPDHDRIEDCIYADLASQGRRTTR